MKTLKILWPVLLAASAFYLAGLPWGLPSSGRARAVFAPSQLSDAFYRALEDNRRAMYERIGLNIQAAYGRGEWNGELLPSAPGFALIRHPAGKAPDETLMHAYSSFMLRSEEQDEQFSLNSISHFKPRRLDFNPHQTSNGGAYIYPLAAFFAAAHVAGFLKLVPDALYYYRNPGELARLFAAGRFLSVLCGLACLLLIYRIAALLYDERTGFWAAALAAFTPVFVCYTHIMKPHVPGTMLSLACLWYCFKGAVRRRPSEFLPANLFFGLAVGATKYSWVLALPMWACYFLAHPEPPTPRQWLKLVGWNALAVLVFCATNPYGVWYWRELRDEMRAESGWYHPSADPTALLRLIRLPLRLGLGWACWGLGLASVAGLLWRRSASDRLLAWTALPLFAAMTVLVSSAAGDPATVRFFLSPIALLLILTAGWLLRLRAGAWILGAALAFNLGAAALYDLNFASDSLERSNGFAAARWISENLPKGSALGFNTPAPMLDRFPPLRFLDYELVYFKGTADEAQAEELPEYCLARGRRPEDFPDEVRARYEPAVVFDNMSWRGALSLEDQFTSANFPVTLLKKKS